MKKITVIPNHTKDVGLHITARLIKALSGRAEVYMHKFYQNSGLRAEFVGDDLLYKNTDAVIVLGGDGTILQAAEPCAELKIPVMGINLGRIGFMTEIEVDDIESAVDRLLANDYKIEERMMMRVYIEKNNGNISTYYALNDVVISKPNSEMIFLTLFRENEKINEYIADGLIIATPTGSTGYSLSAGGPVADPTTEMFIATPICAHMLTSRSAILPADKNISVTLTESGHNEALVTVDGQIKEHISPGEHIMVNRAESKVMLIKMGKQSFFDIFTKKLS